ncbi:MAG: UPF0182 family protein [Methanomicrobiales archaeon]|nr:UPF0182 family protein [Methanomicrobiales archaeon]
MRAPEILAAALVAAIVLSLVVLQLLADWYWFLAVGYGSVFVTILTTRIALFLLTFLGFTGFLYASAFFADRTMAGATGGQGGRQVWAAVLAGIAGLFASLAVAGSWETVLRFANRVPFGVADPIFSLDVGFYVFELPLYHLVLNTLLALFILGAVLAGVTMLGRVLGVRVSRGRLPTFVVEGEEGGINWKFYLEQILPQFSVLLFLIFSVVAAKLWLARYDLVFSASGAVFGAGYTDIHVNLPVLSLLAVLAFAIGIAFLATRKSGKVKVIAYGILIFLVLAMGGSLVAAVMQGLVVEPDEFNLEREYLGYNIQHTLAAYGLDGAQEQIFSVNYTLTARDIAANNATVENIRLWDWRPLKATYEQLQLFRTYYEFNDIDVDRYLFNGRYKEVLISAREMNIADLPLQAQTWVNTHLVYTHGYGAVMNPVDQITDEGLPVFYLKDIPPASPFIALDQPRIYYGEMTGDYAVTGTSTDEFDYPAGEQNIYTSYTGTGGVPLSDGFRRLVYGLRFGSVELLVSGSLTPESRLLMHRNVGDRVSTIAPFLSYDPDPYIVIAEGKLYWIIDAYTTTDRYPYSAPVWVGSLGGRYLNYIRNSVKVVVDAYDGTVTYYVVDPSDPLVGAYRKIFPDLFREFDEMPPELREHVRYPEGIFEIQANLYATYHMKDPRVFYNREDAWVIPDEVYRGSRQRMQAYYVIMRLPGEATEEFIMMLPFTPRNKENMIGWMAARSDPPLYGKLIVYQFSKQELTYGPMQVEARIDQTPEISQSITLWSQAGSSVLRGNTLVIPIQDSIIYVEPLYLEATERGTLPQLQRVIVAYHDRLTMQKTLAEALDVIFGTGAGPADGEKPPLSETDAEKLARIAALYDKSQQALAAGDLGLYQKYIDEMGVVVQG